MTDNKQSELSISIQARINTIRVHKNVIRALNNPEYICLRVNEDMSSIAILPCKSSDLMSFRVPEGLLEKQRAEMRIFSKSFIQTVLSRNGLETEATYSLYGKYLEGSNAIIFSFSDDDIIKREPLDMSQSLS